MLLQINKSKLFNEFFEESESRKINYLVLHHIQDNSIDEAILELKKHKVSSHYIIDENGDVYGLVDEKNIAYHAGISYWNGKFNLNDESIGIEFLSCDPYKKGFNKEQIESGIKLCQNIIKNHNISQKNIVGHSDIAYDKETGFLNRKDDPSHLFPWGILAKNNVGIFPEIEDLENDKELFKLGDKNEEIKELKKKLKEFGYKIDNLNRNYGEELNNLIEVFNRRFSKDKYLLEGSSWYQSSNNRLKVLRKI